MKTKQCMEVGFLVMAVSMPFQRAGFAETIRGEVSSVNSDVHFLQIISRDRLTRTNEPQRIQLQDQPDTVFEGIWGLDELKRGDEVLVDVIEYKRGPWAVKKIQLEKSYAPASGASATNARSLS
ncbi:MAG: hypothetical protein A2Y02_02745 [Omnitrophica bacterium GWA2_52_12]|nr:MAG: hypothetical protein A2Y02_02745 [Omnitrophica bacterium GWA2_52_12]